MKAFVLATTSRLNGYRALRLGCTLGLAGLLNVRLVAEFAFVHPGLLQSREDLERIKTAVAARQEPIFSGYEKLRIQPASQSSYVMRGPGEEIGRNPTINFSQYDSDANASYQCALMWTITGEIAYATKVKEILNAWSAKLKRVSGADAVLMAGLGPFKMVNAAEIIRHTNAGWPDADIRQAEQMFKEAIYPTLKDFAPFANGNWDTAAIKTVLAIAVFCNDRAMFERALRYYVNGMGDGRLTHYIINDAGQCQESGRDQQHTQLGLAHLGDSCEIAWHQGLDLYSYADLRLRKGFEYTAQYNLSESVPFVETLDRTGKYHHTAISTQGRGNLRPVYEQIYNHYVNRVGMAAPWTQKAAGKIRPEGPGQPGADHPGFGTLLYSRSFSTTLSPAAAPPSAPAATIALAAEAGIELTWITAIGATSYTVKRADETGKIYAPLATEIRSPAFRDATAERGKVYRYVIAASNSFGTGPDSFETSVSAGLPSPWKATDIGDAKIPGRTSYDGQTFTIEGAGFLGGTDDQIHFVHAPATGNGSVVARFVPPTSSQLGKFGLMLRESRAANAACVALLFVPDVSQERERPPWVVQCVIRQAPGGTATTVGTSEPLAAPGVTYGRLLQPHWLRLERTGDTWVASMSPDGSTWTQIATAKVPLKKDLQAGVAACSNLSTVTTTVMFDHMGITPGTP